jgi:hypothetical protein
MINGGSPDSSEGIWIYGDSFVESQMHEFDDTFQGLLAAKLGPNAPQVATLNASGAGLVDQLNAVRAVSKAIDKPIHVVLFSLNDYSESMVYGEAPAPSRNVFRVDSAGALHAEYHLRPHDEGLRDFAKQSALMRYVFLNLQFRLDKLKDDGLVDRSATSRPWPVGEPEPLYPRAVAAYIDSLVVAADGHPLLLVQDCDRDELTSRLVLNQPVGSPNREALLAKTFATVARAQNVPVLDLCPVFGEWMQQHRRTVDMRPVDKHWNQEAHRLVAHALENRLRALGWVGDRLGD